MGPIIRLVPSEGDYPRLALWIFAIAWLIGNVSLLVGFNGGNGEAPGIFGFAVACVTWWGACRMGGMKSRIGSTVGLLAITIWTLSLAGAMATDYHYYVKDLFFWGSAFALSALMTAAALSGAFRSVGRNRSL
jgi:hypothetical protein